MRTFVATLASTVLLSCGYAFASNMPNITSVSEITMQQYQTITIQGSGFGTQAAPYTGDSPYIQLNDLTKVWQAGHTICGCITDDWVTLIVSSWTDSQITLGGFSGKWGWYNWTLDSGDKITIGVSNPQSGLGPALISTTVAPEPSSLILLGGGILGLVGVIRKKLTT